MQIKTTLFKRGKISMPIYFKLKTRSEIRVQYPFHIRIVFIVF